MIGEGRFRLVALEHELARRAGAVQGLHLVLERFLNQADQLAHEVASIAYLELSGRRAGGRRLICCKPPVPRERLRQCRVSIPASILTAASWDFSLPRRRMAQIIGTERGSFTSASVCSALSRRTRSLLSRPSRIRSSLRSPLLLGPPLAFGLLTIGGDRIGPHPLVALLLVSQPSPDGLVAGIESKDFVIVG